MASRIALDMLSDRDELTSTVAELIRARHSAGGKGGHIRTPLSLGRKERKSNQWGMFGEAREREECLRRTQRCVARVWNKEKKICWGK